MSYICLSLSSQASLIKSLYLKRLFNRKSRVFGTMPRLFSQILYPSSGTVNFEFGQHSHSTVSAEILRVSINIGNIEVKSTSKTSVWKPIFGSKTNPPRSPINSSEADLKDSGSRFLQGIRISSFHAVKSCREDIMLPIDALAALWIETLQVLETSNNPSKPQAL